MLKLLSKIREKAYKNHSTYRYTIVGDEKNLVDCIPNLKSASGQGVVKRVAVTVPDGDWEILVVVDEEREYGN